MNFAASAASVILFAIADGSPDRFRDLEHRSATTPSQRIEIRGLSGSEIEFTSWDKNEVVVSIHVRIESSDKQYEEDYLKALEIRESRSDGALRLDFIELRRSVSGSGFWGIFTGGSYVRKEIRGQVFVPKSNALTTDFSYGSIELADMKGELDILGKNNKLLLKRCASVRRVENDYGESVLQECGGTLDLSGTSSTVTVESFEGSLEIDASYSTIRVKDIARSASIASQSGRVSAENIGGTLTVQADYSTILVSSVKGFLSIVTKSGTVRARNAGGLAIEAPYTTMEAEEITSPKGTPVSLIGQSGSMRLSNVRGDVFLDAPYTNVSLKDIDGSVTVRSKSSSVIADVILGNWTSNTEHSSLRLRGLNSRSVTISNTSSSVHLTLTAVPDQIDIRNPYGGADISLPRGFAGEIALDAEYGSIETDFPIRVKKTGSSAYAVGTVGSGRGKITVETSSASITLLQRSP